VHSPITPPQSLDWKCDAIPDRTSRPAGFDESAAAPCLNLACASLVVEYGCAHESMLRGILAGLKTASLKELAALVAGPTVPAGTNPAAIGHSPAPKSVAAPTKGDVPGLFSSRSPLGLPTLSLLMAFSANPVVIAANMLLMLWNAIPIARRAWRVWSNERRLNVDFLDLCLGDAGQSAGRLAGHLADQARRLDSRSHRCGSRRAISGLLEFRSKSAWIVRDGQVTAIPAAELAVGDLVGRRDHRRPRHQLVRMNEQQTLWIPTKYARLCCRIVVYPGEMIPVDTGRIPTFTDRNARLRLPFFRPP
jgi:hypothetical protein